MPRLIGPLLLALLTPPLLATQSIDAGIAALKAQRWSDAEATFRRVVAANAGDHAAHYWMAKALLAQDRAREAEGHLEKAIALQPSNAEYHHWLGFTVGLQALRASALKQPFLARRVKQEFEAAVLLDPDMLEAREGLFQFYLRAPGILGGGADKARVQQREVARRNAYRGYLLLATLEENEKNDAGAECALRAAMAQFPDSAGAVSAFSTWLVGGGRTPEAWEAIDAYAKRRPEEPLTLFMVGRVAASSGQQLDRGALALQRYLALPAPVPGGPLPAHSTAQFRLGQVYQQQGRTALARAAYQEALRLNPNNRGAKDALKKLGN